uniref:Uncharacterized protein n=1 Tax=Anopheles atroparvus TaxID=41427 RepID=A0AAG5D3D7_ANOAO
MKPVDRIIKENPWQCRSVAVINVLGNLQTILGIANAQCHDFVASVNV